MSIDIETQMRDVEDIPGIEYDENLKFVVFAKDIQQLKLAILELASKSSSGGGISLSLQPGDVPYSPDGESLDSGNIKNDGDNTEITGRVKILDSSENIIFSFDSDLGVFAGVGFTLQDLFDAEYRFGLVGNILINGIGDFNQLTVRDSNNIPVIVANLNDIAPLKYSRIYLKNKAKYRYGDASNITSIVCNTTHVFAAGSTQNTIKKYLQSDLSLVSTSASYGAVIRSMVGDNTYLYAGGDTVQAIKKYLQSDLSLVSTSLSVGFNINRIRQDSNYLFAAANGGTVIKRILKSDLSVSSSTFSYGASINDFCSDGTYLYVTGSGGTVKKFLISDFSLVSTSSVLATTLYGIDCDNAGYIYTGDNNYNVLKISTSNLSLFDKSTSDSNLLHNLVYHNGYIFGCAGNSTLIIHVIKASDMIYKCQSVNPNLSTVGNFALNGSDLFISHGVGVLTNFKFLE